MTKRLLLSLTGLLVCMLTFAIVTPEEGKYYRIVNQNPNKASSIGGQSYGFAITEDIINHKLTAEMQGGNSKYNQLWKYTGGKLQNAYTSQFFPYLDVSRAGYTNTSGSAVTLESMGAYFVIRSGNYVHADASNVIVGWNDNSNKSNWWCFEEVAVDEAVLQTVQDQYAERENKRRALEAIAAKEATYAPFVLGYFEDGACTELKATYKAMTDDEFSIKMETDGLPEELRQVVLNIKNQWKGEHDPKLSQRFRVQDYKIYTRCQEPKYKWLSTQLSDMNNPTGIFTSSLQLMYVFVEGDIPEGATLKIAGAEGAEITLVRDWDGTPLHKGLNILYCATDFTSQWIMYTCEANYNKKLSEYPDLKIHIEGGKVMGYSSVDYSQSEDAVNADYTTVFENAKSVVGANNWNKINFVVKGERGVMLFPIDCFNDIWSSKTRWGSKIYKSMKFYDDVLKWEWSAMGWQSRVENGEADNNLEYLAPGAGETIYPDYVNNLAPTVMLYQGTYPYSSDGYTCMPSIGAVESSYNAERADFDVWCVGHESGHNNQQAINLPSSTESSNNYFSNLITTMYGYRMSRGWNFMSNVNYFRDNIVFSQRDISVTLRMYYNLWLYYHRAGYNKHFTQRLHQLLRADRMEFGGEGWHDGSFGGANKGTAANSWLKFYEKTCEAAGEDLTEYFRLWGFFVPTDKAGGSIETINGKKYAYCGDYSSYYVRCEQSDIDAAIKRVKAKGYRVNKEIMFIEDRQKLQQRHDPWAQPGDMKPDNGGTLRSEEWLRNEYGDLGYYENYRDGNINKATGYSYVVEGTRVSLSGQGGVGVLVYDGDDIVYYSNKLTFTLPADVALTDYTIKVINADGTELEATDATEGGKTAQAAGILRDVVDQTRSYTDMVDETRTKVGYYTPEAAENLNAAIAAAQKAIADQDASQFAPLCTRLLDEMSALSSQGARVEIEEMGLYTLRNNARGRYLTNEASTASDATGQNAKWAFVKAGSKYYMQNYETQNLIDGIYGVEANALSSAAQVNVVFAGNGCWYLKVPNGEGKEKCLNNTPVGEKVIGWSEDEGSQWYITKVADIEKVTKADITNLVNDAKALIAQVGEVKTEYKKLPLQTTDNAAPYYVSTNKENAQYPIVNLVDGDKNTDFYTKKESTSISPHNIVVDFGEGNEADMIRLTISAPNSGLAPKKITVTPGDTKLKYNTTEQTVWENMPNLESQMAKAYDTKQVDRPYRFWRFQVNEVHGSSAPTFGISDLQLRTLNITVAYNEGYEGIERRLVLDADNAQKAAASKITIISTALSNVGTYNSLKTAYDALKAAVNGVTGIEGVVYDKPNTHIGFFDLSGRRVSKMDTPGIYIINGRKMVVK